MPERVKEDGDWDHFTEFGKYSLLMTFEGKISVKERGESALKVIKNCTNDF